MNLTKESMVTLIFQVSGYLCATITGMIIARELGPANRGIISLSLLYPLLFFTLFNFTIGLGILHHIGKQQYDLKAFIGSALFMVIVMSCLTLSVFYFTISHFRETLYKSIEGKFLMVVGIAVPFYLMLYYFSSLLQGIMDLKSYNIANQLSALANLFIVLLFIAVERFTAFEAVIAGISGVVLGGLYSFLRAIKRAGGISFSRELTLRLIKDGAKIHVGVIATFLYTQGNLLILNYYATSTEVGFYSVAFGIANVLFFFSLSLETGLYPKVSHASMAEAVELVQVATRQMLLITFLAAGIMAVFSKGIIVLYGGKEFLPAVIPLLLLLPGIIVFVIPKIIATLWIRKGWFFQLTLVATATALVSVLLNLLLVPKIGSYGAALATTLTYFFSGFIGLFLYWKYVSRDLFSLIFPKSKDLVIYRDMVKRVIQGFSRQ